MVQRTRRASVDELSLSVIEGVEDALLVTDARLGVIAWNAALLPGSKREDFLREMMQTVPPDVRSDMRVILAEMILRKELLFASNKRMIVSFDVTMTPAGPHLSVVSTFDK